MTKTKTVLQVIASFDQGGVERGTLEMGEYIVRQGWRSLVASAGGRLVPAVEKVGCKHFQLPLKRRDPITIIMNGFRLAKIIRDNQVDLVQTRSRAPAWSSIIACKLTGTPLITTFHGTHKIQNSIKRLYNSAMVRGDHIIANSKFIEKHIRDNYGISADKISIAQRGFNPEVFNLDKVSNQDIENWKKEWAIPEGVPSMVLTGRLTPWKGQSLFLDALGEIKDLDWRALIVGGEDKKHSYRQLLVDKANKLGIADKVIFAGSQNNVELFYAAADIAVSASTQPEAFGRVSVEAQAMRTPIIATGHGGALETVRDGETGFLVSPTDSSDMAKILRNLIENPSLIKTVGDNAYEWAHNNFTTDRMCGNEFAAYSMVLK